MTDESSQQAGQKFISDHWLHLSSRTRLTLRKAGFYGEKGARNPESERGFGPYERIRELEAALGRLSNHVEGAGAALSVDEVALACREILYVPEWRDPEFIRLAFRAMASQLRDAAAPPIAPIEARRDAARWRARAATALAVAALPLAMAWALVGGWRGQLVEASAGLYAAAVVGAALAWVVRRQSGTLRSLDLEQQRLQAWERHALMDDVPVIGAGHRFRLEQLASCGVVVPPIAFDLVAALEVETGRQLESIG
ncbi:MAG: hypothetical protein J7549_02905 [Variovorax sp.]|nr:hypothetical protein [Variovorax sp.]